MTGPKENPCTCARTFNPGVEAAVGAVAAQPTQVSLVAKAVVERAKNFFKVKVLH